jgi:hypothetical protein
MMRKTELRVIAVLAVGLVLSACALSLPFGLAPRPDATPSSANSAARETGPAPSAAQRETTAAHASSLEERELSAEEKKAIMTAVAPSLREPAAAKYRWTKFPTEVPEEAANYCATVEAKSPYAPYDGRQAYMVEAQLSGGKVTSAAMVLIAGGKDVALVSKKCATYGLDPNKSR